MVLDCIINSADLIELQKIKSSLSQIPFANGIWIVDFDNRLFQAFEPTKWHEYDVMENQESYLDTLDLEIKMTKVLELDLDNLPDEEGFSHHSLEENDVT